MSEMDKNKNSLLMVIITLLVITIILLVAVIGMMFARNNGDQPVSGNLPTSSQEESSSSEPEESDPGGRGRILLVLYRQFLPAGERREHHAGEPAHLSHAPILRPQQFQPSPSTDGAEQADLQLQGHL